jgi:HSP20 family molecular chaperone IbpA
VKEERAMQTITTQTNGTVTPKTKDLRAEATKDSIVITPPIDVYENTDEVRVFVDLPGVTLEALSLDLEKEVLTLRATREPRARERAVVYKRSFSIPREIADEQLTAKLDAGVLTLVLPKRASSKPRSIKVNAG